MLAIVRLILSLPNLYTASMLNHLTVLPETLYIATTNVGKLRDFAFAAGAGAVVEPLPDLATIPPPVEDELTFEGNARLKAIAYSLHAPGRIVLADDSGLEVDALHGAPGVRSARYADDLGWVGSAGESVDDRNNACLLNALKTISIGSRQARYRCALIAAQDGKVIAMADGTVEGSILDVPRGTSGFGYDPLFIVPKYDRTMAELEGSERLACSHRGEALRTLLLRLSH